MDRLEKYGVWRAARVELKLDRFSYQLSWKWVKKQIARFCESRLPLHDGAIKLSGARRARLAQSRDYMTFAKKRQNQAHDVDCCINWSPLGGPSKVLSANNKHNITHTRITPVKWTESGNEFFGKQERCRKCTCHNTVLYIRRCKMAKSRL